MNVLIIVPVQEDCKVVLNALDTYFKGVLVTVVADPVEYQRELANPGFDLVITAAQVPWSGSDFVFDTLQACAPSIPVIMVSRALYERSAVEALKRGLCDFIPLSEISLLKDAVPAALKHSVSDRPVLQPVATEDVGPAARDGNHTSMLDNPPSLDWVGQQPAINEQDLRMALLALFQKSGTRQFYLNEVVQLISRWTGCPFVGIRILNLNGGFPYEAQIGFSPEFLSSENWLSIHRSSCSCAYVFSGNLLKKISNSTITDFGSAFCPSLTLFLQQLKPEFALRYRTGCLDFGIETMALVPIRYEGLTIGLIHVASREVDKLPALILGLLEAVSPLIGEALNRYKVEEDLQRDRGVLEVLNNLLVYMFDEADINQLLAFAEEQIHSLPWVPLSCEVKIVLNQGLDVAEVDPRTFVIPLATSKRQLGEIRFSQLQQDQIERQKEKSTVLHLFAFTLAEILERKEAEELLRENTLRSRALVQVARQINLNLDLNVMLQTITEQTAHAIGLPYISLMLYDEQKDDLYKAASYSLDEGALTRPMRIPLNIFKVVLQNPQEVFIIEDLLSYSQELAEKYTAEFHVRTIILTGVFSKGKLTGFLIGYSVGEIFAIPDRAKELLRGLADLAATAITNGRLFDEIRAAGLQLQVLSRRLVQVQEEERRKLARELHDEIGQILTGLNFALESIQRAIPEEFRPKIANALEINNQLIKQVRQLSLELRPAMLDDFGLLAALKWFFQRFTSFSGIWVEFSNFGLNQRRFNSELETAVFRIIQEALTNVARHARTDEVSVRIEVNEDALLINVEDAGQGFDVQSVLSAPPGAGLTGMRERAVLIGGAYTIQSKVGEGTKVQVALPILNQ